MIPLRDNIRSATTPVVNYALIVLCVAVWVAELTTPTHLAAWAFRPDRLLAPETWRQLGAGGALAPIFTSMFMHDPRNLLHLGFNMLFLWVFGDNVEDRLGHARYAVFYLLCGVVAALAQAVLSAFAPVPMVGASGAIAGVLGAYFVLFKGATVRALVPLFFIVDLPAVLFLGLWFIFQLFSGFGTIGGAHGGVAFGAHIGGFLAGMALVRHFAAGARRPPQPRVIHVRYH